MPGNCVVYYLNEGAMERKKNPKSVYKLPFNFWLTPDMCTCEVKLKEPRREVADRKQKEMSGDFSSCPVQEKQEFEPH